MIASQRLPELFDGIVAGNPAFHLGGVTIAEAWDTIAFTAIAPTDGGEPILSRAFSDDDLALVSTGILAACDGLDGLVDGLVEAPSACTFDPGVLVCPGAKAPGCLSSDQVEALDRSFAGPRDAAGTPLYTTWPWDAGVGSPGWRAWKLGTSATATSNAANVTLGFEVIRYLYLTPPDPDFDPLAFDFDVDPARMTAAAEIVDAVSTDLRAFRKRRGKILFYAGLGDPVFSANDLIDYYDRLAAGTGGLSRTRRFARLFLVPGLNHCVGGPALDRFDPLTPLVAWVEKGRAPRAIVATGNAFPGRSRPLCPYPEESRWRGSGSIDDARRFRCVVPAD
jgi:feruloyl esterase